MPLWLAVIEMTIAVNLLRDLEADAIGIRKPPLIERRRSLEIIISVLKVLRREMQRHFWR